MLTHARAIELAVTSIDFALGPRERLELGDHLESCSACRGEVSAYHSDASRLRDLKPIAPPAWVARRVTIRRADLRWLLVAAMLLLAAAMGISALAGALRSDRDLARISPSPALAAPTAAVIVIDGVPADCGHLVDRLADCRTFVETAWGGLTEHDAEVVRITVAPGTLRGWCVDGRCASAPPDSAWITFDFDDSMWESIPARMVSDSAQPFVELGVYLDEPAPTG